MGNSLYSQCKSAFKNLYCRFRSSKAQFKS